MAGKGGSGVVGGAEVLRLVLPGSEAVPDLVDALEGLLDRAEAGELRTLLAVGFSADGSVFTFISASEDMWRDLAALERLKHRLMLKADEVAE